MKIAVAGGLAEINSALIDVDLAVDVKSVVVDSEWCGININLMHRSQLKQ